MSNLVNASFKKNQDEAQIQLVNAYKKINTLTNNLIEEYDKSNMGRIANLQIRDNHNDIISDLKQFILQLDTMNSKLKESNSQLNSQMQEISLILLSCIDITTLSKPKANSRKPGLVVLDISMIESGYDICENYNNSPYLFKFIKEENQHYIQDFIQLLVNKGAKLLYHYNCQEYGITFKDILCNSDVWRYVY